MVREEAHAHIERATLADEQAVRSLLDTALREQAGAMPTRFRDDHATLASDAVIFGGRTFAALLAELSTLALVARADNAVAGVILARFQEENDSSTRVPRRYLSVQAVVVAPDQRRRGIGRALVQEAQRLATERGASGMEMEVWASNAAARSLFRPLGYTIECLTLRRSLG